MKEFLSMVTAALLLVECNTFESLGKDIGKAGDKIEEAARKK